MTSEQKTAADVFQGVDYQIPRQSSLNRRLSSGNGCLQRPLPVGSREYAHALVELQYAEHISCVFCRQTFHRDDRVTACPNSQTNSHALIPGDLNA